MFIDELFQRTAISTSSVDNSYNNDSQTRQNSTSFGKPKLTSTFGNPNLQNDYGKKEESKKEKTLNANNSTLSLHITAYENSIDGTSDGAVDGGKEGIDKKKENISSIKSWKDVKKLFNDTSSSVKYAFELQRQQENQKNDPEVMQFKASQRLSNVNGAPSATVDSQSSNEQQQSVPFASVVQQQRLAPPPIHKFCNLSMSNNKNRRKGNAQTASSSRAAELLQASGISIPYLGLDALNLTAGLPTDVSDVNQLIDEIGANVDPELRIIFKKLTKRDLQTREKAAKELMDALKESSNDFEKIKIAFPSYASIYSKLVTDSSQSLRSTSNSILALFVTTLKKDAGTYLKSVIPFLFFSLQDGYTQVAKAAETAVNDCFPSEEKKKLAMNTFGQETSNICLQIMSRQHKLVQPQKFVEEESDAQRQIRLIAQSLNTLEAFIETSPGLAESIAPTFVSSQSFSNLMNMDTNVKAAAFRLLKNLIKTDVSKIVGTRIPAFILQHLDSTDTLLCRNVFECFLIAGKDPKFFEAVKVDKAVIPKFLSLVRKKGIYWQVLETSLLPSISIIYDNSADDQKVKWLKSILDSFFDGIESGLPLFSWSKSFAEAIKFSFLKAFEMNESKDFQAFLVDKVFSFLDIIISYKDKKETVPVVVDLFTWLQSKDIQFDGDTDAFKKKLSERLISKLPTSIFILEPFIEASNDFTIAVELLKSHACPNSTFLNICDLLDEDVVDTSQFGIIIARRIHKETSFGIQQKLIKLLWNLIEDRQVKGEIDTFLKITEPMIARNLVEISSEDLIDTLTPTSKEKITKIVLTEVLKGHQSLKLAEWINEAIPDAQAVALVKKAVNEMRNSLELIPFLDFINITSSMKALASCYKELFEILFELVFKHEATEEEEKDIFKAVKQNAACLGKHFNQEWMDFIQPKISDERFSVKDTVRLAKLVASISLSKEALTAILPSEAAVKHLISNIGSMFILNIVCEPEKHRLFEAIFYGKINPGPIANLSTTTRFAIFYSCLAYENSKTAGAKEKGIFGKTSMYALLTELAIEYKSENGLFSTNLNDFQGYHELFIIIDKILQDSRFDYREVIEAVKEPESRSHLVLRALNDSLKTHGRRHVSLDIIDNKAHDGEDGEAYHMVRICEEVGRKTIFAETNFNAAINYLENYIDNKQQENSAWLFNVEGRNEIRDAASCAILKLFGILIENIELKPKLNDFMLCGFVCAMQTITDSFQTVEGRHYFYSQLAAVYCLQLFHLYDTIVAKQNRNAGLEWNEFYRPAAVGHIMLWVFALEPSANAGFPQYLINKICLSAAMLTSVEIKEATIPDSIATLDEPLGLNWDNYDEKSKAIIKFAVRLLFGKSNDTVKFLAVFLLKSLMFDIYDAEKPKPIEAAPPSSTEKNEGKEEEDETMEQQLEEASLEQKKKLPALFEKVLSPQSSSDIRVLPKLMVWDSLIHFLSELDVLTRVQYTLALPVVYTDEILNVLFELLPKDPEKRLKELSYKGKLNIQHLFAQKFDFHLPHGTTVDHYICNLFYRTLSTLPSIVRNWYTDLPRSRSVEVHDYIKRYLTPLLIARELNSLGNIKRGRLTVKVLAAVNEIDAAYSLEDATLSLKISLPDDYPLSKPIVDTQRAIVNKDLLRKWLLQLILFLSQQNGLMLDGILQWKRNIDNHLEGIEDCTICMMTVSTTNYSLPKIKCRQCRKKFHGDCLYKWFDTSNNATCPLCRSPFYY